MSIVGCWGMRRRYLMGTKSEPPSDLPSEYVRLSYIENTGTAYINTEYNRKLNTRPTRVVVDFAHTNIHSGTNEYIFGVANDDANRYSLALFVDANRRQFAFTRIGESGSGIRFATQDYYRHLFEYVYKEGVYFDGVLQESTISVASATLGGNNVGELPFGIFTTLRERVPYTNAKAKIYLVQFWDDTGLARNYLPAQRKADGKIGMYDTVTKSFFTSATTDEFIGG